MVKHEPSIAVVGHLVADEIIRPGGEKVSALGGISYNLATLLAVMKSGKILPVCEIGRDIEPEFNKAFGSSELVDSSGVKVVSEPNVVNRLEYDNSGNRTEWNSRIPDRLSLENIRGRPDAVLMNFISGDDLAIEDLTRFRGRFNGLIYLDYHSLALGRDDQGKRFYRKHPDWEKYVAGADIVQMNSMELATIAGKNANDAEKVGENCKMVHDTGPKICVVTLGKDGLVLSLDSGKTTYFIPSIPVPLEVDPTGCGDTFASVFLYSYLLAGNVLKAAKRANKYAAAKATFAGIDGFDSISEIADRLGPSPEPVKI